MGDLTASNPNNIEPLHVPAEGIVHASVLVEGEIVEDQQLMWVYRRSRGFRVTSVRRRSFRYDSDSSVGLVSMISRATNHNASYLL